MSPWHVQTLCLLLLCRCSGKRKGTDLGESTCGSASNVWEPDDSRLKFLAYQKFIRLPIGSSWLGHGRSLLPPVHCTRNDAWRLVESYGSKLGKKWAKILQYMSGLSGIQQSLIHLWLSCLAISPWPTPTTVSKKVLCVCTKFGCTAWVCNYFDPLEGQNKITRKCFEDLIGSWV